jgi:hypothetical protein
MLFLIPVLLFALFMAFTKNDTLEKVTLFSLSGLMGISLILLTVYSLPGKNTAPIILPFNVGYSIAIETLKNPKIALFGFGTNNFGVAYNQLRPAGVNLTDNWAIRFNASTNEVFQTLTTIGILGLAVLVWMALILVKMARTSLAGTMARILKVVTFTIFLTMLVVPATYTTWFLLAVSDLVGDISKID